LTTTNRGAPGDRPGATKGKT